MFYQRIVQQGLYDRLKVCAIDLIDLGDWEVVPWTARLRGRSSRIEVLVSETDAVRIDRGRIARVHEYRTPEEAVEAVGRGS